MVPFRTNTFTHVFVKSSTYNLIQFLFLTKSHIKIITINDSIQSFFGDSLAQWKIDRNKINLNYFCSIFAKKCFLFNCYHFAFTHIFLSFISIILNINCFCRIFAKKRNSHSHFEYIHVNALTNTWYIVKSCYPVVVTTKMVFVFYWNRTFSHCARIHTYVMIFQFSKWKMHWSKMYPINFKLVSFCLRISI